MSLEYQLIVRPQKEACAANEVNSGGFSCCMAKRTQREWKRSFWQVGAFRMGSQLERLKWLMELTKQTRPALKTINPYL